MKKLSKLKLKNFTEMDESEMKNVIGGGYGGSGTEDDPYQLPEVYAGEGTCGVLTTSGIVRRNMNRGTVNEWLRSGKVQNWCCDNCNTASWY